MIFKSDTDLKAILKMSKILQSHYIGLLIIKAKNKLFIGIA